MRRPLPREPIRGTRLALLGVLSLTATGLVIGAALRNDHHAEALAAAVALQRASAATPAPVATTPAPTSSHETPASAPSSQADTSSATSSSVAAPQPSAPTPPVTQNKETPAAPTPTTTSKVKHVFVIALTSPGYDATFGQGAAAAPYLNTQLRPQGELLSGYRSISQADLPNYIAMVSGQPANAQTTAGCTTYSDFPASVKTDATGVVHGDGCVYPVATLTLPDQLTAARHTWRAYLEDLDAGGQATSCRHPDSGAVDGMQLGRPGDEYATRHNPFVYFHSLLDLGDCATNDLPLTKLGADLTSASKTPGFSYIAPNLCSSGSESPCADGSPGGLAAQDAFLAQWVPQILAAPAYKKDGLLAIVFGSGPATDATGVVGGLLVSRFLKAGSTDGAEYNHYSLLRTVEDVFGVDHLGEASGDGVKPFDGLVSGSGA